MAPHHSSSDSESSSDDEGAPETISLAQSKKEIQKLDAELKKAEIAARKSKKSQNREMDRKLKERADMNRGGKQKGDDDDDEVGGLEARMNRAMQEAQEEMDEDGESGSVGDSEKDSDDKEEQEDVSSLEDEQGSEEDEDEDEDEEEEDEEGEAEILPPNPLKIKHNANHLPDELFTAAFASKASTSKRKAPDDNKEDNPPKQTSKKPKRSHTRRDLIVGSRAIRMLPTPGQPIIPSAAPSSKIKKFLNRSLALKGGKQQSKTWERRSANIGVFRRDGPASNFVRNR